ncbi:ABC transporter permease [Brachybacterium paraconglomeratum]|uniref:ABC transporter permease n=1 Tax=Brachybacterium paraconglomeratum TaxID=173362 RepID=UPI003FCF5A2E
MSATETTAQQKAQRPRRAGGLRFLGKRLGMYLATAVVAVALNFFIPRFIPGDPVVALVRQLEQQTGVRMSSEQVSALYSLYGDPNQNLIQQFVTYVGDVLQGDFGISVMRYPTPVADLIADAMPWTIFLAGVTTVLAWIIGTVLGAMVGWKPGSRVDNLLTPSSQLFTSFPAFWIGMVMLWLFSFVLGWFPRAGGYSPDVPFEINNVFFLLSVLEYGALPMFTLILVGFAGWLFSMRNMMVTTISEDYVTLAKAKGLPERQVLFRYAARNALLPNVTNLAMAMGTIIGGTVLAEIVFTYPGVGMLLLQSIVAQDYPLMQTIFLMLVLSVLVANFIADSIYVILDPRTREN